MREPVFGGFANNKGVNQTVHPRRLISAFIIQLLELSYLDLLQIKSQFSS